MLANGAAEIRARHLECFKELNLFGKLPTGIVLGNLVVDHETVRRIWPEGPGEVDVIASHGIADGKIARAWFKTGDRQLPKPQA